MDRLIEQLRDAHKPNVETNSTVMRPRELVSVLTQELERARERSIAKLRADIRKARGEISSD